MAQFLCREEFKRIYIPRRSIGSGSFGNVYLSDVVINGVANPTQVAVKNFHTKDPERNDELLESFTNELNFYQYLSHPHLCDAIAWSMDPNILDAQIVIPLGVSLFEALQKHFLSWEQLITQILLALEFLHTHGVAHGDLKPGNILFFPTQNLGGLVKLIDFGLTRHAQLIQYPDDPIPRYYITNVAYSSSFRDPEYSRNDWNPIEVELYAFAYTLYYLHQQLTGGSLDRVLYTFRTGVHPVDTVIGDCTIYPAKRRPSARMILDAWLTPPVPGTIRSTPVIPLGVTCQEWEIDILDQAATFAGNSGSMRQEYQPYPARLMFLMLNVIHRSIRGLFQHKPPQEHIDFYILACYFMVENAVFDHPTLSDHLKFMRIAATPQNRLSFLTIYQHILMVVGGVVGGVNTFWEAAVSGSELPPLLRDTVSCYYDPQFIRKDSVNRNYDGSSKQVTAGAVVNAYMKLFDDSAYSSKDDPHVSRVRHLFTQDPPSDLLPAMLVPLYLQYTPPSVFDFSTSITKLVQSKKLHGEDIALLLRNVVLVSSLPPIRKAELKRRLAADPLGRQIIIALPI